MTFNVEFSEIKSEFAPKFKEHKSSFTATFKDIQTVTDIPRYEGEYSVTPMIVEQTMYTKGKFMAEDVNIKSIPFFDVSNTSGGRTVYIGNEV